VFINPPIRFHSVELPAAGSQTATTTSALQSDANPRNTPFPRPHHTDQRQVWVYGNSFESTLVAVVVPEKKKLLAWAAAEGLPGDFEVRVLRALRGPTGKRCAAPCCWLPLRVCGSVAL